MISFCRYRWACLSRPVQPKAEARQHARRPLLPLRGLHLLIEPVSLRISSGSQTPWADAGSINQKVAQALASLVHSFRNAIMRVQGVSAGVTESTLRPPLVPARLQHAVDSGSPSPTQSRADWHADPDRPRTARRLESLRQAVSLELIQRLSLPDLGLTTGTDYGLEWRPWPALACRPAFVSHLIFGPSLHQDRHLWQEAYHLLGALVTAARYYPQAWQPSSTIPADANPSAADSPPPAQDATSPPAAQIPPEAK